MTQDLWDKKQKSAACAALYPHFDCVKQSAFLYPVLIVLSIELRQDMNAIKRFEIRHLEATGTHRKR